jgi:shikimate dehydrogenase
MTVDGSIRVALIGAGIEASLSPALHEREAAALGLDYTYTLIDLDASSAGPEATGDLLDRARADGLRGVNVTHPCKQAAAEHVDALSDEAAALGAVNTVVFQDDGRAVGHNTDWPGFTEGFRRGLADADTTHVILLGAGGAGSAAAHAAVRDLGARRLSVVDADAARATDLAADVGGDAATPADLPDLVRDADGLVHATPTGMAAHPGIALDPDLLHQDLWVAEIVYRPLETELLRAARERGCRTLDGGGMAVFQAVHALALFTGTTPDAESMLEHFTQLTVEEGTPWTRA